MPLDSKKLTTAGLLRGFGILLLVGSSLFLLDGLNRLRQENIESTWPQAQAQLINCYVQKNYSVMRHGGNSYRTVCRFRYVVNNETLESRTKTTSTQSQNMVNRMGVWVGQHPNDSSQTIHYNPAQPREISLAGADQEIQTFTAAGQLGAAGVLGVVGALFVVIALMIRNVGGNRASSGELIDSRT